MCCCRLPVLLCAAHANGARQYDTHNLFGTSMALNHHTAFKAVVGKRPFLLSRWVPVHTCVAAH
jgi:alpha-glucosidase (family GH31 glycosyl hydrolase)